MLLGCLQTAPEFGRPAANLERVRGLVRGSGADLLVLPELVTTGYAFADRAEALSLAEPVPDGPSVRALRDLAAEERVLLCAGLAERDGDRLYNSAILVGGDGVLLRYRKVHLFREELGIFDPGDRGFPVATLPGGARAGILVCFDWIYPEAARTLALRGADLLLHPANLVLPWAQQAMRTRSLENGVFSLTANRTGEESREGKEALRFSGRSQVTSPRGEVLAELGADDEGLALAEVDPLEARDKSVTPENHLFRGRRPEQYELANPGPEDPE